MQPLLGNSVGAGGQRAGNLGGLLDGITFVFAPVPVDAFADAVDIQSVQRRFFPRLSPEMSLSSKICIYALLLATQLNFLAWFGHVVATCVVIGSQPWEAPLNFHPSFARKLALYVILGHGVLAARAFCRLLLGRKVQSKALTVWDLTLIDVGFWNPTMAGWAIGVWYLLHQFGVDAFAELASSGNFSPLITSVAKAGLDCAIIAWMLDVIMRMSWLAIAKRMQVEFNKCLTHRVMQNASEMPDANIVVDCPICLSATTTEACQLSCGHIFHRSCFMQWARVASERVASDMGVYNGVNCPMCRTVPDPYHSSPPVVPDPDPDPDPPVLSLPDPAVEVREAGAQEEQRYQQDANPEGRENDNQDVAVEVREAGAQEERSYQQVANPEGQENENQED